jgi:hypothetical protein
MAKNEPSILNKCSAPYIALISFSKPTTTLGPVTYCLRISAYCGRSKRYRRLAPSERSKYTCSPEIMVGKTTAGWCSWLGEQKVIKTGSSRIAWVGAAKHLFRRDKTCSLNCTSISATQGERGRGTSFFLYQWTSTNGRNFQKSNPIVFRYRFPIIYQRHLEYFWQIQLHLWFLSRFFLHAEDGQSRYPLSIKRGRIPLRAHA